MPEGIEVQGKDTPVSSFDVGDESIADEISTGEDDQVEKTPRSGFEKIEGYRPPSPPTHSEFSPESVGDVLSVPDETTQLPDIGEASFGPPDARPETVHGADDRFQITNTAAYPWRAPCVSSYHRCGQLVVDRHRMVRRAQAWCRRPWSISRTAASPIAMDGFRRSS